MAMWGWSSRDETPGIGDLAQGMPLIFLGLGVCAFAWGLVVAPYRVVVMAGLVGFGGIFGTLYGLHHARTIDQSWFTLLDHRTIREATAPFDASGARFVSATTLFTTAYVVAYLAALCRSPIPFDGNGSFVVLVTTATLGAQCYFCMRYACYMRMLVILDRYADRMTAAIRERGDRPKEDRQLGLTPEVNDLRNLHRAAFRDEQLYEPPGNIFVSMGITATFLGLAVGLTTLDLTAIADRQFSTVASFVGCMGLSLGISMLGVVIAICAQWLRGHGPSESTEALLARAHRLIGESEAIDRGAAASETAGTTDA